MQLYVKRGICFRGYLKNKVVLAFAWKNRSKWCRQKRKLSRSVDNWQWLWGYIGTHSRKNDSFSWFLFLGWFSLHLFAGVVRSYKKPTICISIIKMWLNTAGFSKNVRVHMVFLVSVQLMSLARSNFFLSCFSPFSGRRKTRLVL